MAWTSCIRASTAPGAPPIARRWLAAGATLPLGGAWLVELGVWGETYFLSLQDADAAEARRRAVWSARSALLVGVLF